MIKHIWTVLCRQSLVNQANNSLSLIDIVEGLNIEINKEVPKDLEISVPIEYDIVSFLTKDNYKEEEAELKVTLCGPEGEQISDPLIQKIIFPKNKINLRQIIKGMGFKAVTQGRHFFLIELKQHAEEQFKIVAEIPIDVTIKSA